MKTRMADFNLLPPLDLSSNRTESHTADTLAINGPTWAAASLPCFTSADLRSRGGDVSERLRDIWARVRLSSSGILRGRPTLPLDFDPFGRPRGIGSRRIETDDEPNAVLTTDCSGLQPPFELNLASVFGGKRRSYVQPRNVSRAQRDCIFCHFLPSPTAFKDGYLKFLGGSK